MKATRDAAGHQHMVIAQPFDGERAALQRRRRPCGGPGRAGSPPRTAAQAPEPQASVSAGAALPDAQAQPALAEQLGDADVGALGEERSCSSFGPSSASGIAREHRRRRTSRAGCPCWCRRDPAAGRCRPACDWCRRPSATGISRQSSRARPHVDGDHRQAVGCPPRSSANRAGPQMVCTVTWIGLALVHHHRGDAARGVAAGAGPRRRRDCRCA